jgi:hypothetical protein
MVTSPHNLLQACCDELFLLPVHTKPCGLLFKALLSHHLEINRQKPLDLRANCARRVLLFAHFIERNNAVRIDNEKPNSNSLGDDHVGAGNDERREVIRNQKCRLLTEMGDRGEAVFPVPLLPMEKISEYLGS